MKKQTDFNSNLMREDFGTVCLITNPISDKYLKSTSQNRLSKWCGGKGGFDDYVERFAE